MINKKDIKVVIMAGGMGVRLHPFTKIIPKPLIPIGEFTIIERIINNFITCNINDFIITTNYKKDFIKQYLVSVKKDYELDFVEEDKPLGTAGSLSIVRDDSKYGIKTDFFVSNCDILVRADYIDILNKHKLNQNMITIVVSSKSYSIPYSVVDVCEKDCVKEIKEKPSYSFLVNTGMYVLSPKILELINEDSYLDMTDLIDNCINNNYKVGYYSVSSDDWLDMGDVDEMKNMIRRFS